MYKETEDSELLYLIEENNEDALLELIDRYSATINALVAKYKTKALSLGLEIPDIYQEGLIGLINGVKNYNQEKEVSFKTYARLVIDRQILDLIKINDRIKHKSLNSAVSLDKIREEKTNLYNIIEMTTSSPERNLINEEDKKELKKILTNSELKVYELKYDGKSNREIAIILDKSTRSIENTIQWIKQKIKERI